MASAFTLFPSMAQRRARDRHPVVAFFVRRFFRITPLFWLAIPLYLLYNGTGPGPYAPEGLRPWHVAVTAAFLHGWHPETIDSVVPGGWSIAVESSFICSCPCCSRGSARFAGRWHCWRGSWASG
jgi:peptidoglycan/LPS O-acetylase OafA/YrhL